MEGRLPDDEVVLKTIPAMLVAARRTTIPRNEETPVYLDAAFNEVLAHSRGRGAKEIGPPLAIWHQAAAVHVQEAADAAVAIDRPVPSSGRVSVTMLPPVRVAAVVHQGASTDFSHAHRALLAWIGANGYRVAGPYREVYMHHDPGKMSDAATEIQYPVAPLRTSPPKAAVEREQVNARYALLMHARVHTWPCTHGTRYRSGWRIGARMVDFSP